MSASVENRQYAQMDEAALINLISGVAPALKTGAVVYLQGDLGAGKTTVARALIQALGYPRRVKSPTYSLIETYSLPDLEVCHLDLYRLGDAREVQDLGLEEMGDAGACLTLIEWPEKGGGYLPAPDLVCTLQVCGDYRAMQWQARTVRGVELLEQWPAGV